MIRLSRSITAGIFRYYAKNRLLKSPCLLPGYLPGIRVPSVLTMPVTVLPDHPANARTRMTNRAGSAFFILKNGLVHSVGFWLIL